MSTITLREETLSRQCYACPAAWDVKDADGRDIYIRYRGGWLSVNVLGPSSYETVWERKVGDDFDGFMEEDEMRRHLDGEVEFVRGEA